MGDLAIWTALRDTPRSRATSRGWVDFVAIKQPRRTDDCQANNFLSSSSRLNFACSATALRMALSVPTFTAPWRERLRGAPRPGSL